MDHNKPSNNVIQFPGRRQDSKPSEVLPEAKAAAEVSKPRKAKASKKTVSSTVLAIALLTAAVNNFAFNASDVQVTELASVSAENINSPAVQRKLASIERVATVRDAKWEKQLAERLASDKNRVPASTHIGRPATMEEKLRWGTLEEKYTITYLPELSQINSIILQDQSVAPSYVLDRIKFLKDYGPLFQSGYETAKLKSVESSEDKTVESYTLFDNNNRARGEARFELDRHKRLLSLKVEPSQI